MAVNNANNQNIFICNEQKKGNKKKRENKD